MSIESSVVDLSHDPFNPQLNFDCANEYLALGQTASAVSFYLRAAEYGSYPIPDVITYTSLIKVAHCFEQMNDRVLTVSNCLLQAIAYNPHRPEAYFFMSQFHERNEQWQEAYTYATLGIAHGGVVSQLLPIDVGYYGTYCLEFQLAVAAWWIGRKEQSLRILRRLSETDIHPTFANAVKYNLEKLDAIS